MKYLAILLLWVVPLVGKSHCIESFTTKDNFEKVYATYNGSEVSDMYDICISSAGNGKNTLNISRTGAGTISVYHDRIVKIIYHKLSERFEMITDCGLYLTFKTTNMKTRDKIQSYFPGIVIESTWF